MNSGQGFSINHVSVFEYHLYLPEVVYILQRVGIKHEQVGDFACLHGSEIATQTVGFRAAPVAAIRISMVEAPASCKASIRSNSYRPRRPHTTGPNSETSSPASVARVNGTFSVQPGAKGCNSFLIYLRSGACPTV